MPGERFLPDRLVRFCGADCSGCETYQRFLAGDEGGLMNPEGGYRCCWLPRDFRAGRDCEIRVCCEEKGILSCGECGQLEECARMRQFYSQPGYDRLRARVLGEAAARLRSRTPRSAGRR